MIGSGLAWTLLRMSVYTDSLVNAAKQAVASGSYAAVPGAATAYVVRDDIAAAAAGILSTAGHHGITYHATGSASLAPEEIAAVLGVKFAPMTEAQQRAGLEAAGLPPFLVNGIVSFHDAIRAGAFDLVTNDVERLAGKAAESVEVFLPRMLV